MPGEGPQGFITPARQPPQFASSQRARGAAQRYRRRPMGRRYRDLSPEAKAKAIARGKLNLAVYHGRVKRQPCWCGATRAEAHHEDYSKSLEVEWLCPVHHKEADAAKRRRDEGEDEDQGACGTRMLDDTAAR